MNLNAPKSHKSYIRRKRCLHESSRIIQNTMRAITSSLGRPMSDAELLEFSTAKAREIEASCWSPRLKLSDKEYQKKTEEKTQQLCEILIRQNNIPIFQTAGCFNTGNFYNPLLPPPNSFIVQNPNFLQCNNNINTNSNFQNSQMMNQQNNEVNSFQIHLPPLIQQTPLNNPTFQNSSNNYFNYNSQNASEPNYVNSISNPNNNIMDTNLNMNINQSINMMNRIPSVNDLNHPATQKSALHNEKNDFGMPDFNIEEQDGTTSLDNSPVIDFSDISIVSRDKQHPTQIQEMPPNSHALFNSTKRNFPLPVNPPTSFIQNQVENDESNFSDKSGFSRNKTKIKTKKSISKNLAVQSQQSPIQSPSIPQQQNQQIIQLKQQQQQMMQIQQQQQQMIHYQQQQMMQIQQQQQQINQFQNHPQMMPIQQQQNLNAQGFSNQNSGFLISLSPSQQQIKQSDQQQHISNTSIMQIPMNFQNNQSLMQPGQQLSAQIPQQQNQMSQFTSMHFSNSNSELNAIENNHEEDDDDQMGWNENKQYKQFHLFGD